MGSIEPGEAAIRPLRGAEEAQVCARLMAGSEPWLTLRRSYDASLGIVQDPTREVYVVDAASAVAGFVILSVGGPFSGYIQTVLVRPEFQGQGLGSQLVAFAEERIFRVSPNVFLCVSSFNAGARRLYERLGYTYVGELSSYLVRGHSELLFRKSRGPWSEFVARAP